MVERFNAVVRRGNIDLEAWFGARTEPDRSWVVDESTWEFPYRYLHRPGVGRHRLSLPTPVLSRRRPDLLVSLYASPSFVAGLRLAWWRGWRTAIWAEVTFDTWVRRHALKEALKRRIFGRVDGVITAGQDGQAMAHRYGVDPDRIHIVRHVIDVDFFASATALARRLREETRAALGLHGVVYLYVGRLWQGKGVRLLLDAYTNVASDRDLATSLLVVGDGPDEPVVRRLSADQGLSVRLAGFRHKDELPLMYAASDIFVFPTLGDPYGLVVDEAMAAGLPVISTTSAGEIHERVRDGENGYLVPAGDATALAGAMRRLGTDPTLRSRMGARSATMIAPYTPDRWAEQFEMAVEAIVTSAPRVRDS
jgi:glycosyltransferase involved in cell wall biosynthesis